MLKSHTYDPEELMKVKAGNK